MKESCPSCGSYHFAIWPQFNNYRTCYNCGFEWVPKKPIETLAEDQVGIEPEINNLVNDNFWDLLGG